MGMLLHSVVLVAITIIGCTNAMPNEFLDNMDRIANGDVATENQFPYAVSLQYLAPDQQDLDTRGHRCGGALVTFRHALTSASCLHENEEGNIILIRPNEYRVFAGSTLLTNDTDLIPQPIADRTRRVSNFSIHPRYIGAPAFVNDIGVIILETPFAVAIVRPLSLPPANFNPADFTECQVAGWGGTNTTTTASPALRFANKYVYNQNVCTLIYNREISRPNIFPSMVCAASFNILSSGCFNDNGNALICDGTLTGILFVHDDCHSSSYPELYTRVSNYTDWIRSVSSAPTLFTPIILSMTAVLSITRLLFS